MQNYGLIIYSLFDNYVFQFCLFLSLFYVKNITTIVLIHNFLKKAHQNNTCKYICKTGTAKNNTFTVAEIFLIWCQSTTIHSVD